MSKAVPPAPFAELFRRCKVDCPPSYAAWLARALDHAPTDSEPDLDAVLAHQAALTAVEDRIRDLNSAWQHRERDHAYLTEARNPLEDLLQEREDLRASVALGETDPGDLEELALRIEQEREVALAREVAISDLREVCHGLSRQLAEAEAALALLRNLTPALTGRFIDDQVAELVRRYRQLGAKLRDALTSAAALDAIRRQVAPDFHSSTNLFVLQSCHLPNLDHAGGHLLNFSTHLSGHSGAFQQAVAYERQRLTALGVVGLDE